MPKIFENVQWVNSFTEKLPADRETGNRRRQVRGACYSRVEPTPVAKPKLVAYSSDMAQHLGLSAEDCQSDEFLKIFSGNQILPQMDPHAMCYGGHQFGSWAGQLGDGRAINLGEIRNDRNEKWVLQLKGAGLTPYSRTADGLAVLRSSVREFLCSEAMHHLEIPTTRALSLILSGEDVVRDMFYDGHPKKEPGAIVCRTASSFLRFGNFEILAANEDLETLTKLIDYTIQNDFPGLGEVSDEVIVEWFRQVCQRTALMVAHWMRVGFVHGVMNTDNMSILGLTIDYGPYGWLEGYDPYWTPNTTDASGKRYRFEMQPNIAHWNLLQLGNVIHMLIPDLAKDLQEVLNEYPDVFESYWRVMLTQKLGFKSYAKATDHPLTKELFEILQLTETDMTLFFRNLADLHPRQSPEEWFRILKEAYYFPQEVNPLVLKRTEEWLIRYFKRLEVDALSEEVRKNKMNAANPKYVLRNYLAQLAIDRAEKNDFSGITELLEVLKNPYTEQKGKESFAEKRPEWARHRPGCSMLSCSS